MTNKKIIRKKILLLGAFAVGKTSLANQFTTGKFSEQYISTIGVNIKYKNIEFEDKIVNLLIWDIADIVTHQNIPSSYLKGTEGIMLVYDVTRTETFTRICLEYEGFLKQFPELTKIVVGNKIDLVKDLEKIKSSELNQLTNIYTSAKIGKNVEDAFNLLIHQFAIS